MVKAARWLDLRGLRDSDHRADLRREGRDRKAGLREVKDRRDSLNLNPITKNPRCGFFGVGQSLLLVFS
jgi:hypothetical protein